MSAEMSFPGGTIRAISLSYRLCRCGAGGSAGTGRVGTAAGDCLVQGGQMGKVAEEERGMRGKSETRRAVLRTLSARRA